MKINDIREIEIFHTLEKIKEVNEAILFHQKFEEPDHFTIRQWQRVKNDLQRQFGEMLAVLDALPLIPEIQSAGIAPKKRGMSPEHMAKIREARIAKRAEANSKLEAEMQSAGIAPKKHGMSPEHMAKIREARMAKRTEANSKLEAEMQFAGKAPKKRGTNTEHMAKTRETDIPKRTEASKVSKVKGEKPIGR